MGTSVSTPPPRDLAREGRDTLQAQIDLAPQQFAAEAIFQPQYAKLARQILGESLYGTGDGDAGLLALLQQAQPAMNEMSATANRAQREADVGDVEALGGRATAAWRSANPEQADLMEIMNRQAREGLEAGAGLDPSMRAEVQQATRAGQAARGMGFGLPDVSEEALMTAREGEAMRDRRQAFAGQVVGLNQATAVDPFQAIMGRPAQSWGAAQQALGQAGGVTGGPNQFDPWSSYAADLYNTNFNAKAAANIASANNQTALIGAGISAAGSAASSL